MIDRIENPSDDDATASGGHNPYNQHLENCDQCRHSPDTQCDEGDRSLHESVVNGTAGSYDRELDKIRNPHLKED